MLRPYCYPPFVPRLLIATNNPGKVREMRELLSGCSWPSTPQYYDKDNWAFWETYGW